MTESLVIAASSDRKEVDRIFRLLKQRGITATIETRTVFVGGESAEGYRLRIPPEAMARARKALVADDVPRRDSGEGWVDQAYGQDH